MKRSVYTFTIVLLVACHSGNSDSSATQEVSLQANENIIEQESMGSSYKDSVEFVATETTQLNRLDKDPFRLIFDYYKDLESDCKQIKCTKIGVNIPKLIMGDEKIAERINNLVRARFKELISSRIPGTSDHQSIEELCRKFVSNYEDLKAISDSVPPVWHMYVEGDGSIIIGDSIFTLLIAEEDFMGGAHPNYYGFLRSYSLESGEPLFLNEIHGSKLLELAEQEFRVYHKIIATESLKDAGFDFPNNEFTLPESVGYTKNGVTLIYNPERYSPFAKGATVIHIPLEKLNDV